MPTVCRRCTLRKTGALIRASVAAGAIMGGADDRIFAALDAYGLDIGLAFQIVDDILDVEGSAGTLGKTAGKDAPPASPPTRRSSASSARKRWRRLSRQRATVAGARRAARFAARRHRALDH